MLEFNIPSQAQSSGYYVTRECFQGERTDCSMKNETNLSELKLNLFVGYKDSCKKESVTQRYNTLTSHAFLKTTPPPPKKSLQDVTIVYSIFYPLC